MHPKDSSRSQLHRHLILLTLCALLAGAAVFAGCSDQAQVSPTPATTLQTINMTVEKIEVFHFHPTHQCASCTAVGNYAEETVKTYFADEVASGKVVFAHINGDLPENRQLVEKYGVTGSSLWIGVYDASGFHKEENINVWYKIDDKTKYMAYLKDVLEKRLAGDYA